jgi:hypothetical protein
VGLYERSPPSRAVFWRDLWMRSRFARTLEGWGYTDEARLRGLFC